MHQPAVKTVRHANEHTVGIALDDLGTHVTHELMYEINEH